ncbi:hypothetical protein B0H14DRAFT_2622507 [Mycena olivaceomarginata]|nr:hypothetical protein B0H14DRAFT_2622507 [Mycena olivaceomarginata]
MGSTATSGRRGITHQPAIVPVAQHGTLDNCVYFTSADGCAAAAGTGAAAAAGGPSKPKKDMKDLIRNRRLYRKGSRTGWPDLAKEHQTIRARLEDKVEKLSEGSRSEQLEGSANLRGLIIRVPVKILSSELQHLPCPGLQRVMEQSMRGQPQFNVQITLKECRMGCESCNLILECSRAAGAGGALSGARWRDMRTRLLIFIRIYTEFLGNFRPALTNIVSGIMREGRTVCSPDTVGIAAGSEHDVGTAGAPGALAGTATYTLNALSPLPMVLRGFARFCQRVLRELLRVALDH